MVVAEIRTEDVLKALSTVEEPELHKDLVTLNMVQDIVIEGAAVTFRIVLTTPACPLKTKIENDARRAVLSIPGVESVNVILDAHVPEDGRFPVARRIDVG